MQIGDVLKLSDGAHVLVLRLNVCRGKHLYRVWCEGSKKAQKDIVISRKTLMFHEAVLVGKNCHLRGSRSHKSWRTGSVGVS